MTDTLRARLHAALAAADREFLNAGLEPATEEQRECLLDPEREGEALDMLDDWQTRCGLSTARADALRQFLLAGRMHLE